MPNFKKLWEVSNTQLAVLLLSVTNAVRAYSCVQLHKKSLFLPSVWDFRQDYLTPDTPKHCSVVWFQPKHPHHVANANLEFDVFHTSFDRWVVLYHAAKLRIDVTPSKDAVSIAHTNTDTETFTP